MSQRRRSHPLPTEDAFIRYEVAFGLWGKCNGGTMWSKPEQLSAVGTARPVRVSYLVDMNECSDELLEAVFAEAYSRWGGRRTLIVPATADGMAAAWHALQPVAYIAALRSSRKGMQAPYKWSAMRGKKSNGSCSSAAG